MSTLPQLTIQGEIVEVIGEPDISLDETYFGPDDDPTDRLDDYTVTIKIIVHTEDEVEALMQMADGERSVIVATEF